MLEWLFIEVAQWLVTVLPADPLQSYIADLSSQSAFFSFLPWINWVIPVGDFVGITVAWGAAISAWYIFSAAARFLHLTD